MSDYEIEKAIQEHCDQIDIWVEENRFVCENVRNITIFEFEMDWLGLYGRFFVKFDDKVCPMDFLVFLGESEDGGISIQAPMFHSPLGAPVSCSAIKIEDKVMTAIEEAINDVFPKLRPLEINKRTGKKNRKKSLNNRILDKKAYMQFQKTISETGFQINRDI